MTQIYANVNGYIVSQSHLIQNVLTILLQCYMLHMAATLWKCFVFAGKLGGINIGHIAHSQMHAQYIHLTDCTYTSINVHTPAHTQGLNKNTWLCSCFCFIQEWWIILYYIITGNDWSWFSWQGTLGCCTFKSYISPVHLMSVPKVSHMRDKEENVASIFK